MEINKIIKHTVSRVRDDYISDYKVKPQSDFNRGVLLGISIVLTAMRNDLLCHDEACLDDEKNLEAYGLDFDIDQETNN